MYIKTDAWNSATGEMAAATAAVICANRPPPKSRAIKPVRTMTVLSARVAEKRSPISEGPKRVKAMRARSGVSGG